MEALEGTGQGCRVRLCGRLAVERDGRRLESELGPRPRLLFAYLVLNRHRALRRDELIEALWGDGAPASPSDALNTVLSRLRKGLGEGVLRGRSELILDLGEDAFVDVEAAEEAGRRAESAVDRRDWAAAADAARTAREIAEAGFLPEAEAQWVDTQRRRLEELRLRALECLAACGLERGGAGVSEAEALARELIEAAPHRETGYQQLMEALARRGRVAEALEVFAEVRRLLAEDLGTVPGAELRALNERLLEADVPAAAEAPVATARFPLPASLSTEAESGFVGREGDAQRLAELFAECCDGRQRIALLSGEPGIGKTRLVTEFARRAHERGAVALYGRCDEEPLLPHQPFVEALRHYVTACPRGELQAQLDSISGELLRVVPELGERVPGVPQPLEGDPEGARSRLFEAITALISAATERRPVVLVLDDLHWADTPSLLLLRHLARATHRRRLLVLATYRDTELEPEDALNATLLDLLREHRAARHSVKRLDSSGVAALVDSRSGADSSPELSRRVYESTHGNPFFVVEMLRHVGESDLTGGESDLSRLALTEGVRELIARRVVRLGADAEVALRLASVMGMAFELELLERVGELETAQLLDALERAVRAGLIEEAGRGGRYSFSHALVRETLYSAQTSTRRALAHRRVAAAIEEAYAHDLESHRGELAHHFAQAGSVGDLDKAIEYGARAGEHAVAQLAYEQAAALYRQAATLIVDVDIPRRQAQRCELVIAQGEAERRAGDASYRSTLLKAAQLAGELGDTELMARAALANTRGMFSSALGVDRKRVDVLEHTLEHYDPGDSPTRAALLSQLAIELVVDPDWQRRTEFSDEALAMARRLDDPRTLALVLNQRYAALFSPHTLAERQANSRESSELASRLDDPLLEASADYFGANVALESGDRSRADRLLARLTREVDELGQPIMRWYHGMTQTKRALMAGSPLEAERLAMSTFELGQRAGQPDALAMFMNQLFWARYLGRRLDADDPDLPALFELPGDFPVDPDHTPTRTIELGAGAVKSVTFCEVGREEDGRRHFDALMGDGLELLRDFAELAIPATASIACARLRDKRRARELYGLIEPFEDQLVDWGPSWLGAATHHLARLAATLGDVGEADERYSAAIARYERIGARSWLELAERERTQLLEVPAGA